MQKGIVGNWRRLGRIGQAFLAAHGGLSAGALPACQPGDPDRNGVAGSLSRHCRGLPVGAPRGAQSHLAAAQPPDRGVPFYRRGARCADPGAGDFRREGHHRPGGSLSGGYRAVAAREQPSERSFRTGPPSAGQYGELHSALHHAAQPAPQHRNGDDWREGSALSAGTARWKCRKNGYRAATSTYPVSS